MLPIGDVNPVQRRPVLLWLLVVANLGVFLFLQVPATGCAETHLIYRFGAIPRELTTLTPLSAGELEQLLGACAADAPDKNVALSLFTSVFLHGGLGHLIGNLLYLIVFGNNVEDRLGHARFLLFTTVGAAAATLSYVAVRPDSIVPLIGFSGAVSAVLGAYLILYPRAQILALAPFPLYLAALVLPGIRIVRWLVVVAVVVLPAWLLLGVWFVLQFATADTPGSEQIAYQAHIGGFIAGIVLLLVLDSWRRRHRRDPFHTPRRRRGLP